VSAASCPLAESAEGRARLRVAGDALRRAGVRAIVLAHGTFAGGDALGVWTQVDRLVPWIGTRMRAAIKQLIDAMVGDTGNYTQAYAESLAAGLNDGGAEPAIDVRRLHWSSENHHVGRADGAVRLVNELAGMQLSADERVLLWGHSHAGNVFALATHLLAGDPDKIERLFDAARIHFHWPVLRWHDLPHWRQAQDWLLGGGPVVAGRQVDIVTFGTPLRYGWDLRGCRGLLHFVHHRPGEGVPEHRAPFPPRTADVLQAAGGDYVQLWGIAGTNFAPNPVLTFRTWLADRRLNRLLQRGPRARDLWRHLQAGRRVAEAGHTLLVDYGPQPGNIASHLAGHAVYTRAAWQVWHVEEVVRRLYATNCVEGDEAPSVVPTRRA
jgi:hypothetical protein